MKTVKLLAILVLGTGFMYGQASRTWVSGVGDDANPCSRTAPCKTFAGAISKTAAGGEIDALDPAGYGAVTITKAITIDGGGGQVASVLVSGTNGIVVQAGPSDVVILRNLRINGIGTGINGIRFLAGKALIVDKCEIFGFTTNGVDIALGASASAYVTDTNIQNLGGTGIRATTTAGVVTVSVDKVRVELSNKGIESADHSRVNVNNSFAINAASIGFQADGDAVITVNHSVSDLNGSGVQTGPATASGSGTAWIADSEIAFDTTGFNQVAGTINTFGNNRLHDNTSNGTLNVPQPTH